MSTTYAIVLEQGERNWSAYVPDLPGCMSTGKSMEETLENIREAIQGHLDTLRAFGEPIPIPASRVAEVEIESAA